MIKEEEIVDVLGDNIPGINQEFEKIAHPSNIYKAVQCFARLTNKLISTGEIDNVKQCFYMAERLWKEGNQTVKTVVENVYLFSISPSLERSSSGKINLKQMLCPELRTEYSRQTAS